MGEIGIPRREFLYDLRFWEVRRIIRGYRRRHLLNYQLLATCAYASIYTMRDPQGKTAADLFPSLFADDEYAPPPISAEDRQSLTDLMARINSAPSA